MSIVVEGIEIPERGCLGCHYRTGEFCGILEEHDRIYEYAMSFKRSPYCPIKELISCKDCEHHIGENGLCEEWGWISTADEYYCASATRKAE